MPGKVKDMTFPDGQTRKVEELEFSTAKEEWNEYRTTSGMKVKMKSVVLKMYWILDAQSNRMYTPEGEPFIIISSNNQVVASEE